MRKIVEHTREVLEHADEANEETRGILQVADKQSHSTSAESTSHANCLSNLQDSPTHN